MCEKCRMADDAFKVSYERWLAEVEATKQQLAKSKVEEPWWEERLASYKD